MPFSSYGQQLRTFTASGPVDISAERLEYNKKENTYTATGKVELKEGTRTLFADFVSYDEDSQDVLAEGHVVLQDSEDVVRSERMTLNLLTKEGTIEKGDIYVKKGNFYITGEEIKKTGETTYVIKRGEFTTCGWDRPSWKFSAKDVKVTMQGYATASHATFRILDQPVFYFPWGMFPIKTERQSGFLLPELTLSSSDGVKLLDSYFWAISRDQDATFSLQWIQDRGLKPGVEYRYALSESFKGVWYGTIIDDKEYDHTRYRIRGEHDQVIGKSLALKSNIDYVSDYKYLEDFGTNALERSENSVRSTLFAEQSLKKSLLTAETTYFRNLLEKTNDRTFQYLPFVSFFTEYLPMIKDRFYGGITSDFVNFARAEGDTYSRLTIEPSLRFPFHIKGFNFLASGSFIEKLYMINQEQPGTTDNKSLETFKIEGDANFQMVRNYSTDLFGVGTMQSVIKPRLGYTYIPSPQVKDLPAIDPSDQITETNTITYSLGHYLNALSKDGTRELSLLEVEQTASLSGNLKPSALYSGSGKRLSDIHSKFTIYPSTNVSLISESYVNIYGEGLTTLRTTFQYAKPQHYNTSIAYNYTKDQINEVLWTAGGTYREFDGRVSIRYSLQEYSWIDTLYSLTYHPKCWSITLALMQTRRPKDTSIKFTFSLEGITKPGG
jgi:LPS-assembly protein